MDLALDPVSVNTELAKKYSETYNNFSLWPAPDKLWHVKKYPDDKEEFSITQFGKIMSEWEMLQPINPYAIRKIIEKIQENTLLFCQLEYATRNLDEGDVKNNLLLICQYLQCDKNTWNITEGQTFYILVKETTPLYVLGSIAALKAKQVRVAIISTQKTAAICHLFTDLCAQIGLIIPLIFTADMEKTAVNWAHDIGSGVTVVTSAASTFECTGVVTETADIDSALDVFINSTLKAPWKLQSIFVQESVYDEVKEVLEARCDRVASRGGQMFSGGGKVFVCDALDGGSEAGGGEGVRVPLEAYRTSRELCALLHQQAARALSLWAADSQLAHEVALAAPATLVWLNDYASFHGPPDSSIPLYESLYSPWTFKMNKTEAKTLEGTWIAWNKLTKTERVKLILEELELLKTNSKVVEKVQNYVMDIRDQSFVTVEGGKICFGVERSMTFEEDLYDYDDSDESSLQLSIKAVVNGAIFLNYRALEYSEALEAFQRAGAPVLASLGTGKPFLMLKQSITRKKLKVIRSNFGTIFAN